MWPSLKAVEGDLVVTSSPGTLNMEEYCLCGMVKISRPALDFVRHGSPKLYFLRIWTLYPRQP